MNSPSCSPLLPPSPRCSCSPLPTVASLPLGAPPVSAVGPCVSAGPSRSTCQTSRSQLVTTVPLAEGGRSVPQPRPSRLGCSRAPREPLLSSAPASLRSTPSSVVLCSASRDDWALCPRSLSPAPGSPGSQRQRPFACAWPRASLCTAGQVPSPAAPVTRSHGQDRVLATGALRGKAPGAQAPVREELCVDVICSLHKLPLVFCHVFSTGRLKFDVQRQMLVFASLCVKTIQSNWYCSY